MTGFPLPTHMTITQKSGKPLHSHAENTCGFSGKIVNNSSYTLQFDPNNSGGGQPSSQTLAPNGGSADWSGSSATVVSGTFAWYIVGQAEKDYVSVYWDVPWIGSNNIGYNAYYPLQCSQSGSTSGWHPSIVWTVSDVPNS